MGKFLLFLLIAAAGWLLFKGLTKKQGGASPPGAAENIAERMVKCEVCGVFMPESESVQFDDKRSCGTPAKCLRRQSS